MHDTVPHPLSQGKPGKTFLIKKISGDRILQGTIASLGIIPGTKVHICDGDAIHGSKKIIVRESSLIIDENVAAAIFCIPCTYDPKQDSVCTLPAEKVFANGFL